MKHATFDDVDLAHRRRPVSQSAAAHPEMSVQQYHDLVFSALSRHPQAWEDVNAALRRWIRDHRPEP